MTASLQALWTPSHGKGVRPQIGTAKSTATAPPSWGRRQVRGSAIQEALRSCWRAASHRPMRNPLHHPGGGRLTARQRGLRPLKAKYGVAGRHNDVGKIVSSAPVRLHLLRIYGGRPMPAPTGEGGRPSKPRRGGEGCAPAALTRDHPPTSARLPAWGRPSVQDHVTFGRDLSKAEKRKARPTTWWPPAGGATPSGPAGERLHHSNQSYGFPDDRPHVRG